MGFNNEALRPSDIQRSPGLDAMVCPGSDQCIEVAEGEWEAFCLWPFQVEAS